MRGGDADFIGTWRSRGWGRITGLYSRLPDCFAALATTC